MLSENLSDPYPKPTRISNRVRALLIHIPWYSIEGQRRLAKDCKVSPSTISRLIRGENAPSYQLAETVTRALEKRLGIPLSMRDVFTVDGTYKVPCVCDLTPQCKGCFPPEAYEEDGSMKYEYKDQRPGDWCRYNPISDNPSTGLPASN